MEIDDQVLNFRYKKGTREVFPAHKFVKNWQFKDGEEDEASMCHYMAKIAEKNGLTNNDLMGMFPGILRMLKSKINWAGND